MLDALRRHLILYSLITFLLGGVLTIAGIQVWVSRQEEPIERIPATRCHGIWMGHTWVDDAYSDAELQALADRLLDRGITCWYMHTTPLLDSGGLDYARLREVNRFVAVINEYAPEITLYAWMGVLSKDAEGQTIGYKFDLEEYERIDQIKQSAFELVDEIGFDGIHLNIEPLRSGDRNYLTLLSGLKAGLNARGKPLSIAALFLREESDALVMSPSGEEVIDERRYLWSWRPAFYGELTHFVDQLVVMTYNKGFDNEASYSDWIADQVEQISGQLDDSTDLIIGVPTYNQYDSETIQSALRGLDQVSGLDRKVQGVSIYAEWTTDEEEWKFFEEWGRLSIPAP